MNKIVEELMNKKADYLSKYACQDNEAIRLKEETSDIRTPFFRDADRIIYSLSYTRYIDKTQVFSFNENDNISKRMTHVQMVSKVARTIGRALGLNEDLIEAASLGHDLGHVPFGHIGEAILDEISMKHLKRYFNHNINSIRILMILEKNGLGSNLCIQTLDAIMCHNGEFLNQEYYPKKKTVNDFLTELENSYIDKNSLKNLRPMTLEGCVVRISDMVAYLGRDIEDAIRLGIIKKKDIPLKIRKTLGEDNRSIINTIILDIINNSVNKPYLKLSADIYEAINELKSFNYKKIYKKANSSSEIKLYRYMFNHLFKTYLNHLCHHKTNETIYTIYLNNMAESYLKNNSNEQIAIDYISGMTDNFFKKEYDHYRYNS